MLNSYAQLFVDFLEEKELHFDTRIDSDGDSVIEFPYKGKEAKMFFTGDKGEYLSIFIVYERTPAERTTDTIFACNELNAKYKWVKFYLDRDNDVILQVDGLLAEESAADEAFELLIRMFNIGEKAKPDIMRAIFGSN